MASNEAVSSIVSLASAFFNKKKAPPIVPYTPVDLAQEQGKSVAANSAAESDIEKLLTKSNDYSQKSATDLMNMAVPGYSDYASKLMKSGQDALDHPYDLPAEVQANLARISAEKGLSTGTGSSSEFGKYSALRDLGQNMLSYGNNNFQKAIQALTTVTGTAPRINPMSPMSFYFTPQQFAENQRYTNTTQQQIEQGGANANTAAKNWNTQNLWDSLHTSAAEADTTAQYGWEQFAKMYTGGMMGGSGAGGGGGGGGGGIG